MGGEEEDLASGASVDVLVPCDVAGLTTVAQTLRGHAASLETAGSSLSRVEVTSWRGSAATGFATAIEPEPGRWRTASDAFVAGAVALDGFVASVDPARQVALEALVLYRRYVALTAAAGTAAGVVTELPVSAPSRSSSVADRMRVGARIDQLQTVAAGGGAVAAMVAEAEALRRQAISTLVTARRSVEVAGDLAAAALDGAAAQAPQARRFWEENIRPAGAEGVAHGALDGLGWVPGPVGIAASGVNALWFLAEGRRTEAGLSAAGMVWFGKGVKLAKEADAVVIGSSDVMPAVRDTERGWPTPPDPRQAGHVERHMAPWALDHRSQFFDGVDVEMLSDTTRATGYIQGNGNTRYLMRAQSEIGVDRETGLPTDIYTVIRRPDGTGVTMFPGSSVKS